MATLDDSSAALASADLVSGLWFGSWVLVTPLGHGAQSTVWEARPRDAGESVALKLLSTRLSWDPAWRERFRREAAIGARLSHPSLVRVLGAGEARGRPWMAQELVPGGRTLGDDITAARRAAEPDSGRRRRLPPEHFPDAARLFLQVAQALHVVHEAGVLHRDIKPGNILVTPAARPKLGDFGCAAADESEATLEGTPSYRSPEQVRGEPLGRPSDIFSLGATLHEALTLRRAFDGRSAAEVHAAVRACRPVPANRVRSEVPRPLAALVARCLQADPQQRYATAADVAAELERFLAGEPVLADDGGGLARARRWFLPRATS